MQVVAVGADDLDRNGQPVPMEIAVGDVVRFRFGNEAQLLSLECGHPFIYVYFQEII